VADIATKNITSVSPDQPIREAARIISKEKIRGLPVVDNDKPVGIVSTVDITRALAEGREDQTVRNIMSTDVQTITEDAYISLAIEKMESRNISRLIVVNSEGKVTGIITRTDILCRIAELCRSISSCV
jgi:hypothetical protein